MLQRKILKKVLTLFLLLIICLVVWQYKLLSYAVTQGIGQFKIIYYAQPIEKVLADTSFPDSLKTKLRLVKEIKAFAIDSLGLNDSHNYTTLYDQKGKPLLWVLTASEPYQLKAKEWDFPFVGRVAYKGFFNKKEAEQEEKELTEKSYDTEIGTVGGWSTLGWFKDPILSNMLNRSDGGLANLIIHELTHATVYVKNNVDFNENLANFIGNQGAFKFLEYKYGKDSKQYIDYTKNLADEKLFNQHILNGAKRLEVLYKSFENSLNKNLKDSLKQNLIQEIFSEADTLSLYNKEKYQRTYKKKHLPNNAYFMSFKRYDAEQDSLEKEFKTKFGSDFKQYLEYWERKKF